MNGPVARLEQRLRAWLAQSLAHRISAVSVGLTLLFVLLVGGANFGYILHLHWEETRHEMAEAGHAAADHLTASLNAIGDDLRNLANNPTVSHAVLEGGSQDQTLRPLLARFQPRQRVPCLLCVLDVAATPLGCSREPDHPPVDAAWLRPLLETERGLARILGATDAPHLQVAQPIVAAGSGTPRGILLAHYDLRDILAGANPADSAFARLHPGMEFPIQLLHAGQPLLRADLPEDDQQQTLALTLVPPLDGLGLHLVVAAPDLALEEPALRLVAVYATLLLLLLPVVYLITRRAARAVSGRLAVITRHAENVAETGLLDYGLIDDSPDELGRLARSFVAMTQRVREINRHLQETVAERARELAESEAYNKALFEGSKIPLIVLDPTTGQFIDCNSAAAQIYGLSGRDEVVGKTPLDVSAPCQYDGRPSAEAAQARIATTMERGMEVFDWLHQRPDGSLWDAEVRLMTVRHRDRVLVQASLEDITERNRSEARMREAMVVFNASAQGIMTTDPDGVIISVNPAFTQITGYGADEAIGNKPSLFKSGRHDQRYYQGMYEALAKTGRWESEIWNRRKNGEIYPQWQVISAVKDSHGQVVEYVSMFSDITQRKRQEEAIWRQANFDALTGLANRSLMLDRLQWAMAQARRHGHKVGLLFIDLDGFKWINDTLGHDVGDELLVEVARRLESCVREQDTVARLGGDEFTLIVQDLHDAEDLRHVGDKVMAALREPFGLAGHTHRLSGSAGVTVYPDDGNDVQGLLKNADIAMYKAKQAGKNRFQFYAHHMQVDAQARVQMENDLRLAIEGHGLALHYQPVVDADSGELVGAEALIRWPHAARGMVSPLEFIPVAEDSGLIIQLGEWALREAARQWGQWRDGGLPPLRIAVNVSGVQFREDGLPELVARVIEEYGVDRGSLMLEITESVLMDGSAAAETRMQDIKAQGVGYALDDFGTGFSSLSYLKRFPVDIVKIDRSFINDCPDDRNDAHLVEAIINMAHSLSLDVTAEGVETEAQLDFLRDLGCDYLQGYLISRPLPADEFAALIRRHHLLPASGTASPEGKRLLAALRQDNLDVDVWLARLLGERSPELAAYLEEQGWESGGLNLKHAVEVHLDWRRRLNDHIGGHPVGQPIDSDAAHSVSRCQLGQWIQDLRGTAEPAHRPHLAELDHAHREFHHLAGQIVDDFDLGYRDSARRTLSGLKFRTASRNVVVALIDCFRATVAQPPGGKNG